MARWRLLKLVGVIRRDRHSWRVHGTAGKLMKRDEVIDYIRPSSFEREWAEPIVDQISPAPVVNQHEEWLTCILKGHQPELSNLWAARHVTEIMLAAVASNKSGRRVSVETQPQSDQSA